MTTLNAFLTKYSDLAGHDLATCSQEELGKGLWTTSLEYDNDPSYVHVGFVDATFTLLPRADVVNRQIAALRQEQQRVRAEAAVSDTRIEAQINSLLAIEGAATEVQP